MKEQGNFMRGREGNLKHYVPCLGTNREQLKGFEKRNDIIRVII